MALGCVFVWLIPYLLHLASILDPFGVHLCPWGALGVPGESLGGSFWIPWGPWGSLGDPLGVHLGHLGVLGGPWGVPWGPGGSIGAPLGILEGPLGLLGAPMGAPWGSFGVP